MPGNNGQVQGNGPPWGTSSSKGLFHQTSETPRPHSIQKRKGLEKAASGGGGQRSSRSNSSAMKNALVEKTLNTSFHQPVKTATKRIRICQTGVREVDENSSRKTKSGRASKIRSAVREDQELSSRASETVMSASTPVAGFVQPDAREVGSLRERSPQVGRTSELRRLSCSLDQNKVNIEVTVTTGARATEVDRASDGRSRHDVVNVSGGSTPANGTKPGRYIEDGSSPNFEEMHQIGGTSVPVMGGEPEIRGCHSGAAVPSMSANSVSLKRCGSGGHEDVQVTNPVPTRFSQEQRPGLQPTGPRECFNPDVLAYVGQVTETMQSAYATLRKKYKELKTRQFAEIDEQFDSQSRAIEGFPAVAEELGQHLRSTISMEQNESLRVRARETEAAYIESQNELALERAKNLELRQELDSSRLHESRILRESVLMRELLRNLTNLTISSVGKSAFQFCHEKSGFVFKLEQNHFSESVGGEDAVLYTALSPETLSRSAPYWMHSQIVFDMSQVQLFFRRILAAATGTRR